jgi:polysaccharide export outer membrane protein
MTQSKAWSKGLVLACLLAMLTLALGGCSVPHYTDYDTFMKTPRPIVGGKPYVIEPPDGLRIVAPNAPEIHNATAQVRPDGFISLFLLGDVFAAGKTPTQLGAEIEEAVLKYYQDVTVQVQIVGFNSKEFYLAGELGGGVQRYTGRDTVLNSIIGRIGRSSWPEKMVVIRPNEQGELIRRMSVNAKEMIEKGDLKYNAVLEEGDIIFMPINPFAAFGVVIQNMIAPIDPALAAVGAPGRIATAPVSIADYESRFGSGYGGRR